MVLICRSRDLSLLGVLMARDSFTYDRPLASKSCLTRNSGATLARRRASRISRSSSKAITRNAYPSRPKSPCHCMIGDSPVTSLIPSSRSCATTTVVDSRAVNCPTSRRKSRERQASPD